MTEAKFDKFYDDFIDLIEENKLLFGGGGCKKNVEGFVTLAKKRASTTNEEREKIVDWLQKREEVASSNVGKLKDSWNGLTIV